MLSKSGLAIGAFAAALTLMVTPIYAQATKTTINAATIPAFSPLEYKDPTSGKVIGFDIDLFEAIAKKMGAKVNWVETDWQQLTNSIKTKRADVIVAGMSDTPQLRERVSFVDYLNNGFSFVTLRDSGSQFPDTDALCGKSVANMRNSLAGPALAQWSEDNCVKAGKRAVAMLEIQSTSRFTTAAESKPRRRGRANGLSEYDRGEPLCSTGEALLQHNTRYRLLKRRSAARAGDQGCARVAYRKWNLSGSAAQVEVSGVFGN
ncbi:transporter substrate-binding domain-containing protein [Bradyrhizobium sp. INPA03-11B]